jgi:hypothetical protein
MRGIVDTRPEYILRSITARTGMNDQSLDLEVVNCLENDRSDGVLNSRYLVQHGMHL